MIDTDFRLLVSADTPTESAARAAAAVPSGGIFYYALGGGMGHLMRAHAIARSFSRIDSRPFVTLTNSRFSRPEVPIRLQLEGRPLPSKLTVLLSDLLTALSPSILVVDAFPAGILSELEPLLPGLVCRKIAVLRRLEQAWVEKWNLPGLLPFTFDGVAIIEPGARFPGYPSGMRTLETAPVLARSASELLSRSDARALLAHETEAPLVVAATTGVAPGQYGILRAVEYHLHKAWSDEFALRLATPLPPAWQDAKTIFHVPLMEVLTGVDLVVGACGYNLAHETAALGVPAIFVPQGRTYDDQVGRAEGRVEAHSSDELDALIGKALSDPSSHSHSRPAPDFTNGAHAVAEFIASA